jgi:hypothetical protein
MNCRDVREIADSFLCEELLTETNHEILRHLETCPLCRTEIDARRRLRGALRDAFNRAKSQTQDLGAIKQALVDESDQILTEDLAANRSIGRFGAELIGGDLCENRLVRLAVRSRARIHADLAGGGARRDDGRQVVADRGPGGWRPGQADSPAT